MKTNKNAFTLIEMIVGVGLTMILMISVGIFVSSGMANITIQKQILDQSSEIGNLGETLNNVFAQNSEIISNSSTTSILVKSNYVLGKPAYYNIKMVTATGYCQNEPNRENKYLEIKNFNPFILTGAIYSGSYIDNVIYSGGKIIAGKGVFGDNFVDGSIGTGMYINNPAGIAYGGGKLYISDSGNNRIVYMSGSKMYKLLDIDDGIYNPTGLLYIGGILYILNSGKNELLSYSSENSPSKPINIKFTPGNTITINKIEVEVLPDDFNISGTYSSGNYIFGGISENLSDTVTKSANKLTYNFIGGNQTLNNGTEYRMRVLSFTGTLSNGNYYLKMNLYSGSTLKYEKYFPYVTNGDNNLITMNDNTLVTLTGGISSNFTKIKSSGNDILLNNYIAGEYLKIDSTSGSYSGSGTLLPFNIDDFESITKISDFKVKDFSIMNDGKILTLKLEYYKIFSCYNDKDSVTKTILLKKAISN